MWEVGSGYEMNDVVCKTRGWMSMCWVESDGRKGVYSGHL